MSHLDFILWVVLFPIVCATYDYIVALTMEITQQPRKELSKKDSEQGGFILVIVWVVIAFMLY